MVRDPDWRGVAERTKAQAKALLHTSEQLQVGIMHALENNDTRSVELLMTRLNVVDPRSARRLSDVLGPGPSF